MPKDCQLRRVKYLNHVIEQDHRFIKKKVRASQCFKSFHPAERTLEGIESINMMRKGQVKRLVGSDAQGQAKFVESLCGIAAWQKVPDALPRLKLIFATHPCRIVGLTHIVRLLRPQPAAASSSRRLIVGINSEESGLTR